MNDKQKLDYILCNISFNIKLATISSSIERSMNLLLGNLSFLKTKSYFLILLEQSFNFLYTVC